MENVMLNSIQTQIKIVDFGLSNVWSPGSLLRTHCGSPEYAAPELFVTGKHYGPEVDLWSFGIILYGMVIGQLPFVSNHNEELSSQERRKKLVAQINRGLGSQHRRALATFTPEFRNMMSKLLVADTSKRIKIKELLVHPWITEKGRKLIRTNPIKELDSHWQAKIIREIATMIKDDIDQIILAIQDEPLGDIGGMYKILVHSQSLKLLHGDGITRILPSLDFSTNEKRCNSPLMSSRSSSKKQAELNRGDNPYVPRRLHQIYPHIDQDDIKKSEMLTRLRPVTAGSKPVVPDYRTLKSPALRRKAYSATITPNITRAHTSPSDSKRASSGSPVPKDSTERQKKAIPDKGDYSTRKCLTDTLKNLKKVPLIGKNLLKGSREKQIRVQTASERKAKTKSEHCSLIRPVTTGTGTTTHSHNLRSSKQAARSEQILSKTSHIRPNSKKHCGICCKQCS